MRLLRVQAQDRSPAGGQLYLDLSISVERLGFAAYQVFDANHCRRQCNGRCARMVEIVIDDDQEFTSCFRITKSPQRKAETDIDIPCQHALPAMDQRRQRLKLTVRLGQRRKLWCGFG